jgi:hypothetical protein
MNKVAAVMNCLRLLLAVITWVGFTIASTSASTAADLSRVVFLINSQGRDQ